MRESASYHASTLYDIYTLKNIRQSTSLELQLKCYVVSLLCLLLDLAEGLDLLPAVIEAELGQEAFQLKDGHEDLTEVSQPAPLCEGKTFSLDGGSGYRAFNLHLNNFCCLHYYR